jgi:condensin complex subunit 1
MMDVITIIIQNYLCNSTLNTADTTTTSTNLQSFYSILSQRLLDISALVRSRVLKLLIKLTQRNPLSPATCCIPLHLRASLVHGSILRLRDKSSIVRKKAVELLSSFLETHPFIGVAADLGAVSEKRFQERVAELEGKRKSLIDDWKKEKKNLLNKERQVDENSQEKDLADKQDDDEEEEEELPEELQHELFQIEPLLKYYQDALLFAKMLNQACPIVCDLLESSLKTEVVGALKFFVVAHRFEVEGAMVRFSF